MKLTVVVDGQYGSCGKGHSTGYLAKLASEQGQRTIAVRVGGSNAGHTTYDATGRKWSLRHVPVAAVVDRDADLFIAAGSELDLEVLRGEVAQLDCAGFQVSDRLTIDRRAVVVTDGMKQQEAAAGLTVDAGKSTGKGVGAARAARAMRQAAQIRTAGLDEECGHLADTERLLRHASGMPDRHVFIEGVQGHGLSVYGPHYPDGCTSGGTDVVDMLAMARINPWWYQQENVRVVNVMRTYPIRIAGDSGYLKGETSWAQLGLDEEKTTVTNRVRRVGTWDANLARSALRANGGSIWLSMFDQVWDDIAGKESQKDLTVSMWRDLENFERSCGGKIEWVGTGPTSVIETPGGVR